MKNFLKKFISQPLWDNLRFLKFKFFKFGRYAPYDLDIKLNKYLNYDYGYFVELGANDGFTESTTIFLEQKKNWRGILIEPSPYQFLSCCNYRSLPGNKLYCNACVPFNFKKKFVEIEYANLMSISFDIENHIIDFKKHLISGRSHVKPTARSITFGSLPRTLDSILDESNAPKTIDFLSLDVEGSEIAVLKGINFKKYKFKYMLIECRRPIIIKQYLKKHGYLIIEKMTHHDYLFAHKSLYIKHNSK